MTRLLQASMAARTSAGRDTLASDWPTSTITASPSSCRKRLDGSAVVHRACDRGDDRDQARRTLCQEITTGRRCPPGTFGVARAISPDGGPCTDGVPARYGSTMLLPD